MVVSRSQVDHIWYPGRLGYAFMKALTEAGSLGGSKLNLKGTGWKTDGTSRSMDGDEVASRTDCTVMSGTRLTPQQALRERAGVICPLGVGVLRGNDARRRLRREVNARRVPRWGASVVDSLDSQRGVASCLATLPRLLLLRRGRRRDKPECCSSAMGGRRRRVRRHRAG
jgi:hypothetical protein